MSTLTTHGEKHRATRPLMDRLTLRSAASQSAGYRADVDGLRAIAVLAVLFFHGGYPGFGGGFTGVDVFYVISGYLITSLISKEMAAGHFSLTGFYERRMRRIFPALFTVLFFCVAAAALLLAPRDLWEFGRTLTATSLFLSNVYFWHTAQPLGYFSKDSASQILLHTWSLSVEEQFYLVFPAVLLVLHRWGRRQLRYALCFLAALCFLLCLLATYRRPAAAFYLSVPRAWELFSGALLALGVVPSISNRVLREFAGILGLGLILAGVVLITRETAFPGFAALLPCLGACLTIHSGQGGASWAGRLLGLPPIVFVGVLSYSLYLWHWPLLVLSRRWEGGTLSEMQTAVVLVCSLTLAFLSFEFIERPFRSRHSFVNRRQVFVLGLVASAATLTFGVVADLSGGLPGRYNAPTRQLLALNTYRETDFNSACGNWRSDVRSMEDINFCRLGSPASKKILFWGDSHVEQLYPLVRELYGEGDLRDHGALFAIANACLPAETLNTNGAGYHCNDFSRMVLKRAQEPDIDTIFIGFNTWWSGHPNLICAAVRGNCDQVLSPEEVRSAFLSELTTEILTLKAAGKQVILCLPFPMYNKSIPDLEMRNAVFGRFGMAGTAIDVTSASVFEAVTAIAKRTGAEVFNPRESLCPEGKCITAVNGVSIYIDHHHIAESQIGILEPNLKRVLAADLSSRQR